MRPSRHSPLRLALAAGLSATVLALAAPARAALSDPWWSATADAGGDAGYFTSQRIDGRDRPHVAYADFSRAALKYATRRAGVWDTTTVDRIAGQTGWHSALALALDRDGSPRIAYQDEVRGDLRYAWRTAAGWRTQAVDTAGVVGSHVSMALDAAGQAHIAYYDEDRRALRHAWQDGGAWRLDVADSLEPYASRDVGLYTAIDVDAGGDPHIAYYDAARGDLKYAVRRGGVWDVQVLDFLGDVGRYCALALDGRGRASIAYTDFANVTTSPSLSAAAAHGKHVKYAHETPDGWLIDIADAIGYGAQYVSLVLDRDGFEHLTYYDFFQLVMKYSVEHADGWDLTQPGLPQLAGDFPSIAFDRAETPNVSYLDLTGASGTLGYLSQGLVLREPAGGTHWAMDDSATVRWEGTGAVAVEFSADDGATWRTLASGVDGGAVRVRTPSAPTTTARVRVSRAAPFAQAATDTTFRVGEPPAALRLAGAAGAAPGVRALFTPPAPLAGGTTAAWRVCDVAGRTLYRAVTGPLLAGATVDLAWNGRRADGRAAPRGAYVVEVVWAGRRVAAPALLLHPAATP